MLLLLKQVLEIAVVEEQRGLGPRPVEAGAVQIILGGGPGTPQNSLGGGPFSSED